MLMYGVPGPSQSWVAALFVAGAWVYASAGAVAWLRRPGSLMGLLMTAGAFAGVLAGLVNDELELGASADDHRRVLAVVRFLSG